MCTRFYADTDEELKPFVDDARRASFAQQMMTRLSRPLTMSGEIRPTDIAAVIARSRNGGRAVFPMQWGFRVKGLSSPVVNARIESAASKPMFSDPWLHRRCVIPASWYFEWQHLQPVGGKVITGDKYAIQPRGADVVWLAGLYRFEESEKFRYPAFVVLTKSPVGTVKDIHDRMPVMLPESVIDDWISPDGRPEEIAKKALTDLVLAKSG